MVSSGYIVTGTYKDEPALVRVAPNSVTGHPREIVEIVEIAMLLPTYVTPHPQPQPAYLMDPQNPDHLLNYLQNIPGFRITGIEPPPPEQPPSHVPEGAVP